jgi:putative membrane protein
LIAVVAASYAAQFLGLGFEVDVSTGESVWKLFIGVAILSLLNATLGRILKFLTVPLNCLTLGVFSLVVNALMVWLAAGAGYGMRITGDTGRQFLSAFVASLIIGAVTGFLESFLGDKKDKDDE